MHRLLCCCSYILIFKQPYHFIWSDMLFSSQIITLYVSLMRSTWARRNPFAKRKLEFSSYFLLPIDLKMKQAFEKGFQMSGGEPPHSRPCQNTSTLFVFSKWSLSFFKMSFSWFEWVTVVLAICVSVPAWLCSLCWPLRAAPANNPHQAPSIFPDLVPGSRFTTQKRHCRSFLANATKAASTQSNFLTSSRPTNQKRRHSNRQHLTKQYRTFWHLCFLPIRKPTISEESSARNQPRRSHFFSITPGAYFLAQTFLLTISHSIQVLLSNLPITNFAFLQLHGLGNATERHKQSDCDDEYDN